MRRPRVEPALHGLTIHDIARAAGVSTATVSRALRGLSGVAASTREHVLATATRMDYVVSPTASRLSSGRAGSVAVVTPYVARWYFTKVLSGIERVLRSSDLDLLLLCVGESDETREQQPVHQLRRRVDGVLAVALTPNDVHVRDVVNLRLPTSLVGATSPGAASARIDDVAGAAQATQHLVNLGHRRIGLIHGRDRPPLFAAERERFAGFTQAVEGAGLTRDPGLEAPGGFTPYGGEQAMSTLLARPDPPTAVFAMSDEMAFGALRAVRRHGLRPGVDVSVVGFDDHDLAQVFDLTTVAQPVEELGATAARALLGLCGADPASAADTVLPTRLVARGSTGPVRR